MTAPMQKLDAASPLAPVPRTVLCSSLDELPPAYLRLMEEVGRNEFFLTTSWFRNFAGTALDEGQRVRLYGAASGGAPAAVLLTRSSPRGKGFSSLRTLSSLGNYYTCFFAPHVVTAPSAAEEGLRNIAHEIAHETPRWDAVELRPLDVNSPEFAALTRAFQAAGFLVQPFFCFGNWHLPLEGRSYAEYIAGLPSILRNTLNRKRKKLEKTGGAKIEIVTGGPNLQAAIDDYTNIYRASWKQPEPYPEFIPGLIRTCAAMGALRLGLVHLNGEPVAAQIWIVRGGQALIYKLAYNEKFAELSAGTILTATLMEYAIDVDKVVEIDYLSGDDTYKKDWMSHRRERWGILALNPRTPRGALAIARHFGGRGARHFAGQISRWRSRNQT